MSSHGSGASHGGQSTGNAIKHGITAIHGLGEEIRGNINTFADTLTHTDATKDQAIADRGRAEIETGRYGGTGAGVTPADTGREKVNRNLQGEHGGVGSKIAREMHSGTHQSQGMHSTAYPTETSHTTTYPTEGVQSTNYAAETYPTEGMHANAYPAEGTHPNAYPTEGTHPNTYPTEGTHSTTYPEGRRV